MLLQLCGARRVAIYPDFVQHRPGYGRGGISPRWRVAHTTHNEPCRRAREGSPRDCGRRCRAARGLGDRDGDGWGQDSEGAAGRDRRRLHGRINELVSCVFFQLCGWDVCLRFVEWSWRLRTQACVCYVCVFFGQQL